MNIKIKQKLSALKMECYNNQSEILTTLNNLTNLTNLTNLNNLITLTNLTSLTI